MKVEKISTYITPKTTGYAATGGLVLSVASGLSKNKSLKNFHKCFSLLTILATISHIGLVEYYHHKFKKNKT